MLMQRHLLVKKVSQRLDSFRLNTVVSALMEFLNEVQDLHEAPDYETVETFITVLSPFAPHFAEELWEQTGHEPSIFNQKWPEWDEVYTTFDTVTVAVQVNGKLRGKLIVAADSSEDAVLDAAIRDEGVNRHLNGKEIRKRIYVKNKILSLVVS